MEEVDLVREMAVLVLRKKEMLDECTKAMKENPRIALMFLKESLKTEGELLGILSGLNLTEGNAKELQKIQEQHMALQTIVWYL